MTLGILGVLTFMCMGMGTMAADILIVTMGGTKSHKIPFWELAKGLIERYVQKVPHQI